MTTFQLLQLYRTQWLWILTCEEVHYFKIGMHAEIKQNKEGECRHMVTGQDSNWVRSEYECDMSLCPRQRSTLGNVTKPRPSNLALMRCYKKKVNQTYGILNTAQDNTLSFQANLGQTSYGVSLPSDLHPTCTYCGRGWRARRL